AYNFPAIKQGDVIKREFKTESPEPMQGFALNLRRPQFQDRRIREALTDVLDFESMNRTLFFGLNTRTSSYFQGTDLASSGLPKGKELEILEQYRDKLPPEVFTEEFKLPVYDTPQAERKYLKSAVDLFAKAGWVIKGGKMVNAQTGQQFKLEILGRDPT
ncbi:MAG: ABC transporter substrate-binding protein, partial [Mesorhizobium sp.]